MLQTKAGSSFVTPTDLQQLSAEPKGKRPSGTRMATEPANLAQLHTLEVSKGRRGLSSLKDKFLMKRKAAPVTPELGPVSPRFHHQQEFDYDPRIKGTIIHDFNSPKPRKPVAQYQLPPGHPVATPGHTELQSSQSLSGTTDPVTLGQQTGNRGPGDINLASSLLEEPARAISATGLGANQTAQPQRKPRPLSLDKALPKEPLPVPPSDEHHDSSAQTSYSSPAVSHGSSTTLLGSNPSSRTVRSRNVSSEPSRMDSTMSAVPRHMKSTSSRFSFDMVGAANQEKLLEEKHRQRQMDKGVDDSFAGKDRDSRFDEFDNDDYDYDAMMDDDGLEERIPGVNADAEDDDYPEEEIPGFDADAERDYLPDEFEDELDPDNDQENFSGFVFQRSNPASALASPLPPELLPTPRDTTGKVIGFAVTKDATPDLAPAPSPHFRNSLAAAETLGDSSEGLGIHGLDAEHQAAYDKLPYERQQQLLPGYVPTAVPAPSDDLYYDDSFIDDGLREELNFEPEGPAFDESLFDLNDTDKYGRPIPGAFAQAKAAQQASARQSDETSRMSGQSAVSQSTAHTSLDAGLPPVLPSVDSKDTALDFPQPSERRSSVIPAPSSELAYQAALAEAAHKAAASGKFRRGSSPTPPLAHLTITSPTDSTESSHPHSHPDNNNNNNNAVLLDPDEDYDDGPHYPRGLDDDYDFDDDVIAAANAEALASDADGWYGREFGFYSAPVPVPQPHGHHATGSVDSSSPKPLSAENLFQYANGGYFGPAGGVPVRSASGRMVASREPNLTPITERSEYSNRNSIMSFAGVIPGGGAGQGQQQQQQQQIQSPGLAELAMMEDDEEYGNMSMTALLRLRSRTFGGGGGGTGVSSVSAKGTGANSPEGSSPRSAEFGPPWQQQRDGATSPWGQHQGHHRNHARKGSAFSMVSSTSDGGSGAGSPTLTMSMSAVPVPVPSSAGGGSAYQGSSLGGGCSPYHPSTSPVLPGLSFPPVLEEDFTQMATAWAPAYTDKITAEEAAHDGSHAQVLHASPTGIQDDGGPVSPVQHGGGMQHAQQHGKRPGMAGHRHKGSADSISYVREEGEGGGETRWVMERRRTAETGEVEFVEREVVEGGRI